MYHITLKLNRVYATNENQSSYFSKLYDQSEMRFDCSRLIMI